MKQQATETELVRAARDWSRARRDGPYLLLLGLLIFLPIGLLYGALNVHFVDFQPPYYAARCLIQDVDPYLERNIVAEYERENASQPAESQSGRPAASRFEYPPTIFLVFAPLAFVPIGAAEAVWLIAVTSSFVLACYAVWIVGRDYDPVISGWLICLCVACSEVLLSFANPAGLGLGLCMLAAWTFIEERFVAAGIVALTISLLIKPHDTGPVWLYFLLAGGIYRKRALQTLLAAATLGVPAVIWVSVISPHWIQELRSNLVQIFSHGDLNDPAHGVGMMLNLQVFFSRIKDVPAFYNLATYVVIVPLLLIWAWISLRSRPTRDRSWLALATISVLGLLPVYHRISDAPIILLAIPACAALGKRGSLLGRVTVALTAADLLLTSLLLWLFVSFCLGRFYPAYFVGRAVSTNDLSFPVPLIVLATGILFLWAYIKDALPHEQATTFESGTGRGND